MPGSNVISSAYIYKGPAKFFSPVVEITSTVAFNSNGEYCKFFEEAKEILAFSGENIFTWLKVVLLENVTEPDFFYFYIWVIFHIILFFIIINVLSAKLI